MSAKYFGRARNSKKYYTSKMKRLRIILSQPLTCCWWSMSRSWHLASTVQCWFKLLVFRSIDLTIDVMFVNYARHDPVRLIWTKRFKYETEGLSSNLRCLSLRVSSLACSNAICFNCLDECHWSVSLRISFFEWAIIWGGNFIARSKPFTYLCKVKSADPCAATAVMP